MTILKSFKIWFFYALLVFQSKPAKDLILPTRTNFCHQILLFPISIFIELSLYYSVKILQKCSACVLLDYSLSTHSYQPTIWYDMLCFQFWSAMNILLGTLLVLVFSSLVATNPINGTSESEDQVGRPYAEFAVFQTFHIQMPTIILTFCP